MTVVCAAMQILERDGRVVCAVMRILERDGSSVCSHADTRSTAHVPLSVLGPRSSRMRSGFTQYAELRYLECSPQWGTTDAEIKNPLGGSQGLSKVPSF